MLIDGHSILNRAFFGLPDLTNSEGLHTNAVYGFLNILFKILEEEQPDYLTVAFDVHAPTFRHKMYEAYKGTRKPMDDALRQQVPLMKEMLAAMGVCTIEMEGYEAMIFSVHLPEWESVPGWKFLSYPGTAICCSLLRIMSGFVFQRRSVPEQRLKIIWRQMSKNGIR